MGAGHARRDCRHRDDRRVLAAADTEAQPETPPNPATLPTEPPTCMWGLVGVAVGLAVAQSIIGLHTEGGSLGGAPARDVIVYSVTIEGPVAEQPSR